MNIFINLCENSSIDSNKKIKIRYMICIIILFMVINIKIMLYLLFINKTILLLIRHDSSVKWGYMGNFDLELNFLTNRMGSSGPL